MAWTAVYVLLGVVGLAYAGDFIFALFDDPREPPRVRPTIPLIGHLIGVLRLGVGYYNVTSKKTSAEMYTLGIFNFKIYVCNSPRFMPLIQRHGKTLSFKPFSEMSVKKYANASDFTLDMHRGPMGDEEKRATKGALAPGPDLDDQNLRTGEELLVLFDELAKGADGPNGKQLRLLGWCRHAIMQASSCGILGKEHPYRDPKVAAAFWIWQDYIPLMISGLDILAKKGWAARETMFKAYRRYRERGIPDDAAALVKERDRVFTAAGIPRDEAAQLDAVFGVAIYANSSPTQYWVLWELFSRPELLEELREEVQTKALTGSKETGFTIDCAALKSKCHLLLSLLEETQRTRHIHANIRSVIDDTILDDRYLLKRGNYLQMPGAPIHYNTNIYGPTADAFDPYRFVPKEGKRELPGSSFLAWGAPPYLCPARQFASTELMLLTALFALRFDMEPYKGPWQRHPALNIGELVTVLSPKRDIPMRLRVREQFSGAKWRLQMGESLSRIRLASG